MATECVDNRQDGVVSMTTATPFTSNNSTTKDVSSVASPVTMDTTMDTTNVNRTISPLRNVNHPSSGSEFITGDSKVKVLKRKNTPASLPTVNKINGKKINVEEI